MQYLFLLLLAADSELETNREVIRAAFAKMSFHDKQLRNHLYEQSALKKEYDSAGKLRASNSFVYRRDAWEEQMVTRLVARDGQPLPKAESLKQESRLAKSVASVRAKQSQPVNARDEMNEWLNELADALDFTRKPLEARDDPSLQPFDFAPRPNYRARNMRAKAFEKVRGRVWIHTAENEIAKLDAEVFDTVNIGFGVIGRVEKGSRFEFERKKMTPEHWFNSWQRARFDVRVMLVKTIRQEFEYRWYNVAPRPTATLAAGTQ